MNVTMPFVKKIEKNVSFYVPSHSEREIEREREREKQTITYVYIYIYIQLNGTIMDRIA